MAPLTRSSMAKRLAGRVALRAPRASARVSALVSAMVLAAFLVLVAIGGWGGIAGAQSNGERISRYVVDILVERDGDLVIREMIAYDFGDEERHGILRDIPTRLRYDDRYDRIYRLRDVKVTATSGTPSDMETESTGRGVTRIRIGDADKTITGEHGYQIDYRIEGGLNGFPDHDELYWNAIGQDWSAQINSASVRVRFEAGRPEPLRIACYEGPRGSQLPCAAAVDVFDGATFEARGLDSYEGLTIVVGFPKGIVPEPTPILSERWSFRRAFTVDPLRIALAAAIFAASLAGVARLYWLNGRDWRWRGSATEAVFGSTSSEQPVPLGDGRVYAAEYTPYEGLRPGQIGTLIDETAHPLDVSATIVDLAARGHLTIEEIPKQGWFGSVDWRLMKQAEPKDRIALLPYERLLLDGLFEDGDEVLLSGLKTKFHERLKQVQDALYTDTVARGWFHGRPPSMRARWAAVGIGAVVVAIGLLFVVARWTTFGIVGIAPVLGALVLLAMSGQMPRRTSTGTAVLRRTLGFRRFVEDAETHRAEFAERAGLFYEYLPYAIVFGCVDRWAKAFEGLAIEPASWYASSTPFNAALFASSMSSFSTTTTGTLASTPGGSGGSGFSGGSSGGGGGGGGGGSW